MRLINERKISEIKIQLTIVQNPHVKNPKELWDLIEQEENALNGRPPRSPEFDAVGFAAFKMKVGQNPRIKVR